MPLTNKALTPVVKPVTQVCKTVIVNNGVKSPTPIQTTFAK